MSDVPFDHIGEFRLDRMIQSGTYTLSLKGYQPSLHRPVFIKLLRPQSQQHEQWLERFRREARISARLKHPNIVDVYTLGEHEGYAYMAMAYVDGLSLRQVVERQGNLPLDLCCLIMEQILPALQMSQDEGIVHRDIKPGNLLIDRRGVARITDFGLAHLGQDVAVTQQGAILGTPAYMAPEQVTGEPVSPATDIFSLGATFYELLTGTKAFGGESYSACLHKILHENPPPPSVLHPELPDELDALLQSMLQKEPKERPASAREVHEQLKTIWSGDQDRARSALVGLIRSLQPEEEPGVAELAAEHKTAAAPQKKVKRSWHKTALLPAVIFLAIALLAFALANPFKSANRSKLQEPSSSTNEQISMPDQLVLEKENEPEQIVLSIDTSATQGRSVNKAIADGQEEPPLVQGSDDPDTTASTSLEPPTTIAAGLALVHLSVEPWATIRLDGQPVDSMVSSIELEMAAGQHELVLSHPQFAPQVIELPVAAGEQKQVHFSFLKEAGYLDIQVRPWAEVYLDGHYIDNTPLSRPLVCPAGERLLELRNPNFETYRRVLNIAKGDTVKIYHVMN